MIKKLLTFILVLTFLPIEGCKTNDVKTFKEEPNRKENYKIILKADDPNNPLRVWRIPITSYVLELSSKILGPLKNKNLTPHQKAVLFMIFLNNFKVGKSSKADPYTVVKEKIGECGTFSNVFCALMVVNKIPCRIITLANYPKNNGHAVVEIYYNGGWHLYDPTYAAYYTTTPNEIKNPKVLSFEELRKGKGLQPNVVRVILNPKRLYLGLPRSLDFVGPEIYVKANPAGPIGPENPLFYPLTLDLKNKNCINEKDFGSKNQGASYLGAAGINNNWILNLKNLEIGKIYKLKIIPKYLGGEITKNSIFKAKAQVIGNSCKIISGFIYKTTLKNIKDWIIKFTPLKKLAL